MNPLQAKRTQNQTEPQSLRQQACCMTQLEINPVSSLFPEGWSAGTHIPLPPTETACRQDRRPQLLRGPKFLLSKAEESLPSELFLG